VPGAAIDRIAEPRRLRLLCPLLLALGTLLVLGAPAARAGDWIQVSCVNPDGSAAPSEGWTTYATAGVSPLSGASTSCAPGTPMDAALSNVTAVAPNASENLQYTPPAGSTLVGGTVDVTLSADGSSTYGRAVAAVEEPGDDLSAGDGVFACIYGEGCTGGIAGSDFSGTVSLPADRQGDLYVSALCTALSQSDCDTGGLDGAYAFARVSSADLLLSTDAAPSGTGFSGSALQRRVHHTGRVVFTAADPGGPGVYDVTVELDGRTVSSGTPNQNGGACVPVGTGADGALMFDHQQPCPPTAAIDAPVPTSRLPDGAHRLTVTVVDAAGNASTVLDQSIRTFNPEITPRPKRGVEARFLISWHWYPHATRLLSMTTRKLPRSAHVHIRCLGPHCPRLRIHSEPARRIRRLLRSLRGRRFRPRDRIRLTVTERRHRAERIEIIIRRGRKPRARLRRR
jgi:hypothetical protein